MRYPFSIILLFLNWNCCFSQTTEKVVTDSGKEMEITDCDPVGVLLPIFYFEINSTQYTNVDLLKEMTTILIDNSVKNIVLEGHCSDQELKSDPTLSLERAKEIKKLMKNFGYDPNNIEIKDVKNTQPVDWTGDHQENQRVDLSILKV